VPVTGRLTVRRGVPRSIYRGGVEFRILGPLEVWSDGQPVDLGGLRQRRVLAALLLSPNRVVALSRLADAGWGADTPPTVERQVRNRVAALRGVLTPAGGLIDTDGDGYRLRVGPGELDAAVFEELVARGRAAGDAGLLRDALGLWRGPALAGLGEPLVAPAARLEDQRLTVYEECLELELAAGAHARVLDELAALVAAHPLRERLVGLWMTALYRSGGRAEALAAYQALAERLVDELGVDPGPEVRRVHEAVLREDPALPGPVPEELSVVPAQLPRTVPGFTGRVGELARLDALLSHAQAAPTVVISAIAGTAGVGKTALAVHWAHRVRDKFPDGQLYVNLRGFDPSGAVKAPGEALRGFLDALRVPAQRIPTDLAAQAELYRGLLAGRRMLVLLDNARDADQVRPLLPGTADCLVLITSRNELGGLGGRVHPIGLDVLTDEEARQLLAGRLGADRLAAEPDAVDEIVARCARLPLALAIVAARAADQPDAPVAALAGELRQARGDLGPFAGDDPRTDVRAVFSWSYQALTGAAARLFRLLGLHPGPDLAAAAAASLAGLPVDGTRPLLAELTRAHLLTEHAPGRYTFHDLLRAYAGEQAHAVDSADDRRAATGRLLDHYLHTAYAAALQLNPHRYRIAVDAPQDGVTLVDIGTYEQAAAWCAVERPVLVAAVERAAAGGLDAYAWQLAWTLSTFLDLGGHWQDWVATHRTALAAAERLDDRSARAHIHRSLGHAYTRLGCYDDAREQLRRALDLYRELGDRTGEAHTHHILPFVLERQGRYRDALEHAQAALDLFRASGDRDWEARALNTVGWHLSLLGEHQRALPLLEQALALLQELDNRYGQAATWDSLGYAHRHLGEHDQAVACYRRALDLFRTLGDRTEEATTLAYVGDSHEAAGDRVAARDAWRQALAIYEDLDHPDAEAVRVKLAGG
jgi:DNA-binding SARP family transcriptional activator/tetratricopeptide (TPR) repeat protein